jgi:HEAT repeat protein
VEVFLEDFIVRKEWPLPSIYRILLEIGADALTEPLVLRLLNDLEAPPLRALHFLGAIRNEASMVVVQTLLHRRQGWEQEAALLKSVHDPELGEFVRSRLGQDAWQVVVAAVNALGRIGVREDMPLLVPLLAHREWWVRYRAAHTLVRLPGVKPIEIELQASRLDDPFARDMLRHALAARNMG